VEEFGKGDSYDFLISPHCAIHRRLGLGGKSFCETHLSQERKEGKKDMSKKIAFSVRLVGAGFEPIGGSWSREWRAGNIDT